MLNLYKLVNGKLVFVDYGIVRLKEHYVKQGYVVGEHESFKPMVSNKEVRPTVVCHAHKAKFNFLTGLSNLICKFIPAGYLKY